MMLEKKEKKHVVTNITVNQNGRSTVGYSRVVITEKKYVVLNVLLLFLYVCMRLIVTICSFPLL